MDRDGQKGHNQLTLNKQDDRKYNRKYDRKYNRRSSIYNCIF